MEVHAFFDPETFTLTYVVLDERTRDAVVIDPVLDLDPLAWRVGSRSVEAVASFCQMRGLRVHCILDTHVHADHLSGMDALKERLRVPTAIGAEIAQVQRYFAPVFDLQDFPADGRQFDRLLRDGEQLVAGSLTLKALHTPGHTPACMSYLIGDALFTGDALFMPDYGTGRCDFPGGSASALYDSVHGKLFELPATTRVFVGHDYQPGGRPMAYETTIGDSVERNIQLKGSTRRDEYVAFRASRDATLTPPKLILQSLQVNIRAGKLPEPRANGRRYFEIPLGALGATEERCAR